MTATSTAWPIPRFTPQRVETLQAEASAADRDPFKAFLSQAKLLASDGQVEAAQNILRENAPRYPAATIGAPLFRNLLPAAILVHGADLATAWLSERYRAGYAIDLEVASLSVPADVVRLDVRGNSARFVFEAALFHSLASETILQRWADTIPLVDAFMASPHRTDGGVDINLGDGGLRPGLCFCARRDGYFPIPDAMYMDVDRYRYHRDAFHAETVDWADRLPIVLWRGSTTGIPADPAVGWRSLPRIRLCEIGRSCPDLIDAGITSISQISDPAVHEWLGSRNMLRQHVPWREFQRYRYQLDVDGNSNSWPGLFIKLLTGSPVLKVQSPEGFQQWYYDRLRPWINFIPVSTNMEDLVEKVEWLRAHDDAARAIGEAGRELAEGLTGEQEIVRSAPVFAAAIRTAAGAPSIDLRFTAGGPDNDVLTAGWMSPEADGVKAIGFEGRLRLARPHGIGDFILIAEVSPVGRGPMRVAIVANGAVISQRSIEERTTIYCALPHQTAAAGETLELAFCLPVNKPNAGPENPLDTRMLSVVLHRVAVASACCYTGDEDPELAGALAELRSVRTEPAAHELWSAARAVPAQVRPLSIRTFHDTMLYADLRSGRLRHASLEEAPRNLFLVPGSGGSGLVRLDAKGALFGVQLRPEGPLAAEVDPASLTADGFVTALEIARSENSAGHTFVFRGAGLYVCAELDGEVSLSRARPGPWEQFRLEPVTTR